MCLVFIDATRGHQLLEMELEPMEKQHMFFFVCVLETGSQLCSSGCVDQADLELGDLPTSAS